MKIRAILVLLSISLLLPLSACGGAKATHIYFSISAEAVPASADQEALPAIAHNISLPIAALPKMDVMHAIEFAVQSLGYECVREGKYSEILASVAGRPNGDSGHWQIEGTEANGNPLSLSTDSTLERVHTLSITYIAQ